MKWNFLSDFWLEALLSAFCEHDVQSFTVARWTDFLPYNEYEYEYCCCWLGCPRLLPSNKLYPNFSPFTCRKCIEVHFWSLWIVFTLFHYAVSHFGRNNKKLVQPEILCLCCPYSQRHSVLYCKSAITNDRRAENLCQAPVTGLYRDVHHDSLRWAITLLYAMWDVHCILMS